MRAQLSSKWLSHPRFKSTWVALAAGSLAGLAVLGACSDAPVSTIAGPTKPALRFDGFVGDTHHKIKVCVDNTSSPGTYNFSIVKDVILVPNEAPWFEEPGSNDPSQGAFVIENHPGPYAYIPGDNITSTLQVTVPFVGDGCTDVFVRMDTCPALSDCTVPANNPGNRLWTFGFGIINPYATLDITTTPQAGVTFTVSCTNNDVFLPQTAGCGPAQAWASNRTFNVPRSVNFGGFVWRATAQSLNQIPADGSAYWTKVVPPITSDPIFTSANVFHGSSVTYKFTRTETPCPAGTFTSEIADGSPDESRWPAGNIGDILVRYDQFPAPNDNSYGVNAVGWPSGHTFGNLTGSDKAGVQIRNASSTIVLSMEVDYLTATTGTPSGYASRGVTGGDGGMLIGTAAGISATTSLANNLNTTGYCVALNCTVAGTNLLVNSPPTDAAHLTYDFANIAAHGLWDFHDTYYVRINPSTNPALAGFNAPTWVVEPNLTVLHNSPAKPCPPGPFPCSDITVGAKTVNNKEVKVDVNNVNLTTDAFITGVHITWPASNGALKQIKVGGDVIWTGTLAGPTADLTLAQLTADAAKRKIGKNHDEDIKFTFANNAAALPSTYSASLDFGDACNKVILP